MIEKDINLDIYNGDYGYSEFNPTKYIIFKRKTYEIGHDSFFVTDDLIKLIDFLKNNKFKLISVNNKKHNTRWKENIILNDSSDYLSGLIIRDGEVWFNLFDEIIIDIKSYGINNDYISTVCDIFYCLDSTNLEICNEIFNKFRYIFEDKKDLKCNFNYIQTTKGGYNLGTIEIDKVLIKDEYYNNDLNINKISEIIKSDKNGIIVFSGIPGSGKTTLIKYLKEKSDKNFIVIPINMFAHLTSPDFIQFAILNFKDSVLIVEDCELLIQNRETQQNSAISDLLNLGDGLIGSALNLKIILSYNTNNTVDPALLRKGRTVFMHKFEKVLPEYANDISKDLGYNIDYKQPVPLCDIFNPDDCGEINKKTNKIGF